MQDRPEPSKPERSVFLRFLDILTNQVVAATLMFGLPAIAAFIGSEYPNWPTIVLAASAGFAIAVAIVAGSRVLLRNEAAQEITTGDNISRLLRHWVDYWRFGVQRMKDRDDCHFGYALDLPDGLTIHVIQTKERNRYLTFRGGIKLDEPRREQYVRMKPQAQLLMSSRLTMELARQGVSFEIKLPDTVDVSTFVPITSDLTEAVFVSTVNKVDLALVLTRSLVQVELMREAADG